MATNNAINTPAITLGGAFTMSGAFTFTGTITGNTSITYPTSGTLATVGGNLGAFTATSITFSPTTGGIVGTTTNDNAGAGKVGEYVSANVLGGSAVAITTGATVNITSISLTAGDWDVSAVGWSNPAAGTITQSFFAAITSTSATLPTAAVLNNMAGFGNEVTNANAFYAVSVGPTRFSLSGTTTIYLVANSVFSVSTMSVYGFISARRVR